jgi:hypothetical protein
LIFIAYNVQFQTVPSESSSGDYGDSKRSWHVMQSLPYSVTPDRNLSLFIRHHRAAQQHRGTSEWVRHRKATLPARSKILPKETDSRLADHNVSGIPRNTTCATTASWPCPQRLKQTHTLSPCLFNTHLTSSLQLRPALSS